jgi:hypothetical protein
VSGEGGNHETTPVNHFVAPAAHHATGSSLAGAAVRRTVQVLLRRPCGSQREDVDASGRGYEGTTSAPGLRPGRMAPAGQQETLSCRFRAVAGFSLRAQKARATLDGRASAPLDPPAVRLRAEEPPSAGAPLTACQGGPLARQGPSACCAGDPQLARYLKREAVGPDPGNQQGAAGTKWSPERAGT